MIEARATRTKLIPKRSGRRKPAQDWIVGERIKTGTVRVRTTKNRRRISCSMIAWWSCSAGRPSAWASCSVQAAEAGKGLTAHETYGAYRSQMATLPRDQPQALSVRNLAFDGKATNRN